MRYQDIQSVKACLLKETEERIEILADPNFDCLATNTTAGMLICSDPSLAVAKMELNSLVLELIAKLKENDARDAFAEYERWSRDRDRKCGLADKDNVPLDELSSSEGLPGGIYRQKQPKSLQPRAIQKRFLDDTSFRDRPMPTQSIYVSRKSIRPMLARISLR